MRLRGTFDQTPAYAEFAAAAKSYCENRYLEASRPRVVVYPHPEGGLTIVTRGARASAKNCWSGAWFGAYTFAPQNGGSLRGELRVQVHLYEDGNVQLSPNATLARGSGVGTSASEVFAALTQFEEEAHAAIEEACATLARGAFKTLRRALPITGEKFDFGSGAHSLANELMKH
jgi:capping protein alpha